MTSATDKLRRLLDERGVEWFGSYDSDETSWNVGELTWVYGNDGNIAGLGVVQGDVTPEQAIAVTLGRPTWRNSYDQQRYDQWYDSLFHGEPSSFKELIEDVIWTAETVDLGPNGNECQGVDEGEVQAESMIATWAEKAAALGSEREAELQSALNEVSDKWAHAQCDAEDYARENLLLKAKQDSAKLWRGTCRIEHRGMGYYCSECDAMVGSDDVTSELYIDANAIELWCFCPRCGSVVSA